MQEESINLEEVDVFQESTSFESFPCILLDGIETENEFLFFKNRAVDDPELCVPMYFACENEKVKLGAFSLTLDFLLMLRSIGDYTVWLYTDADMRKQIDLNDAETLLKFVKL